MAERIAASPVFPPPPYCRLPHGPHGRSTRAIQSNQRARLASALAHVLKSEHVDDFSVQRVISLARISRTTIYLLFTDKWDLLEYAAGLERAWQAANVGLQRAAA